MIEQLDRIVQFVGKKILDLRYSAAADGTWEGSQLKTKADCLAHQQLRTSLKGIGENIPVISEEDTQSQTGDRPNRYWLIDPIDGTASFSGGYDGFVTQVALMDDGWPTLAAVHAPALQLTYLAAKGQGATLNGEKLNISPESDRKILIDNYPEPRGLAAAAMRFLGCTSYLESGSIGLKICRIADGKADLFFKDIVLRDWDVAPGHLILTEAGGKITNMDATNFLFDGPFDKTGIIAARTDDLIKATASWLETTR